MFGSACQTLDFGIDRILRKRALAIHADALRVRAKMAPAGETIAAMSADDVTFAGDEIAWRKTFHAIADPLDDADEFVADRPSAPGSSSATTRPSCRCERRSRRSKFS